MPQFPCEVSLTVNRKIPWRLSRHQKYRHRNRLRAVDSVVDTIDNALAKRGETMKKVVMWKAEMPREEEMLPKDKYSVFDRKVKRYRKGIHSECNLLPVDVRSELEFKSWWGIAVKW
jgi:hypothetical protein